MTAELFILLLILTAFGWLIWKGSKQLRGIAAFLLVYGLLRILEIYLFGNGFSNFIRDMFNNVADALSNIANPNIVALAPLLVTILILVGLAILIRSDAKAVRAIAGFAIIYIVVRIFDAVALGNGFSDFVSAIATGLSEAFRSGAANMP
jgi:hypothetical protein